METIQEFLAYYKQLVETNLDNILPNNASDHKLFEAMRYAVLNGGKRIRPIIVYAVGQALGIPPEKLNRPAMAVELAHCYSLVHDDLPAMDDDDIRRGQPSCHRQFSESMAILVGDALQSLAFEVLADTGNAQMVKILAQAIGAQGMVLGQVEDLLHQNGDINVDQLTLLHDKKTGALFNACVQLPLLVATDLKPEIIDNLDTFGRSLGLAFQVRDDILDAEKDLAENKPSFVSKMGLEAASKYCQDIIKTALKSLEPLRDAGHNLKNLTTEILSI